MPPRPILRLPALFALLLAAGCAAGGGERGAPAPTPAPEPRFLTVEAPALWLHGFRESFEIAPVLLAADRHFEPGLAIRQGGIQNLVGGPFSPLYGDTGVADVATHAETQLLRHSLAHPDLRAIMTVTEGLYRIVARRSAGIATLADLKGKRVGTLLDTSADYFLEKMLAAAGLGARDVERVGLTDLPAIPTALAAGELDAIAVWEPEAELAARALGADLVVFPGTGVYREIFNLNVRAEALADPVRRAHLKALLRAIIRAGREMARDPAPARALVARMSGHAPEVVAAAWPHHRYLAGKAPDIVDVLEEEERWLAARDGRTPRPRAALAALVDYSLLDEIMAEDGHGK